MQRAVNVVSDAIFPGVHVFNDNERLQPFKKDAFGLQLCSNLHLQMALYFNAFYFPMWLLITIVMLVLKYDQLHPLYRVVVITIIVVVAAVEVVRLYLGYLGNLSEMIPELAGFWLLTLVLQFPLQMFLLLNEATLILPMERAANLVMVSFILFQLLSGYFAIKKVSKQLAMKFHLETFDLNVPI